MAESGRTAEGQSRRMFEEKLEKVSSRKGGADGKRIQLLAVLRAGQRVAKTW